MTTKPKPSRPLTVLAVGFLLIDAILLLLAGVWSDRRALLALSAVFFLAAIGVVFYYRAHRRRLAEIAEARRDLKAEAEALRELINDT